MDLRERTRQGLTQEHKQLDLDSFGEIMDNFIHESRCGLLVTKEEGEKDFHVQGAGCGAVVDFYIFLNALPEIFKAMLREMGGPKAFEINKLAEEIAAMLEEGMKDAAAEAAGEKQGE